MDNNNEIKTLSSDYDWKSFLVNDKKNIKDLVKRPTEYHYSNKVLEGDREKWCMKAIWIGRSQGNYKAHPEFLYENLNDVIKDMLQDSTEIKQGEKPHSAV